jgi:hypothetical protein
MSSLIDNGEWARITSRTVDDHIRLCHLQSLYMSLEEKMNGSPLDDIAMAYREPLTDDLQNEFCHCMQSNRKFITAVVLPVLRDFMISQLGTDRWDTNASLKEYLGYTGALKDDEIDVFEDIFPDIITLRYAFSLFQYLSSLQ